MKLRLHIHCVALLAASCLAADDLAEPPPVRPGDNAYDALSAAVARLRLNLDGEFGDLFWEHKRSPKNGLSNTVMRLTLLTHAGTLGALHRAAQKPACEFPRDLYTEASAGESDFDVVQWLALAQLGVWSARDDAARGEWTSAVEKLDDVARYGDLVLHGRGPVGLYIACHRIKLMACKEARRCASNPATPVNALRGLIESIEPRIEDRGALADSYRADYHRRALPVLKKASRPTLDLAREVYSQMVRNATVPWAYRKSVEPRYADIARRSARNRALQMLSIVKPNCDSADHCRLQLETDGAGTVALLACAAYARERGAWPPALAALVPAYLKAVPKDPADGAPLRYIPQRRIIYSIGPDLKDNAASRVFDHVFELKNPGLP